MSEENNQKNRAPTLFKDTDKVFEELSGEDLVPKIIEKIKEVVDKELKNSLREPLSGLTKDGISLKAEERHVILRTHTIQLILETFDKNFKPKEFNEILKNMGRQIGTTFVRDLIDFLKKKNKCPAQYKNLIDYWVLFDSSAGMGTFIIDEYNPEKEKLKIKIKNNFLLSKTAKDPHKYCRFIEGYIEGIINGGYLYYYDWIKNETRYTFEDDLLETFDTHEEEKKENECLFAVKLRKRRLIEAEKLLLEAYKEYATGNLNAACLKARSALEFGIKTKIGIEPKHPISFFKIINSFEKAGIKIPEETKKIFNVASSIAHGSDADKIQSYEILNSAQNFISYIKSIEITGDKSKIIRENIGIGKEIKKREYYVLVFGPGEGSEDYDMRVGVREVITNLGCGAIFPEDFKSDDDLIEWARSRSMELSDEEKSSLSNLVIKELILAERCDLLMILLMNAGAIAEFSQHYLDRGIADKMRVFIPEKYHKLNTYLAGAPIKTFENKFKHVYPFKDMSDLKKDVESVLSAELDYLYISEGKKSKKLKT